MDGRAPIQATAGDFLLLPATPAFSLSSHRNISCAPGAPTSDPVRHGDPEGCPEFISLGGTFRIERDNAPLLLALLPDLIYVAAQDGRFDKLGRVIGLIQDECALDAPGRDMVLQRLLEVLLVEALRWRWIEGDDARAGLLNGMRDPMIARVLSAMHADVSAGWTVAELARTAGLSRSAFAARFAERLGCGPIEYLSRWRMALAKDALRQGGKTLDRIADDIGYESASAFSNAFRKRLGVSPGAYARGSAQADPA